MSLAVRCIPKCTSFNICLVIWHVSVLLIFGICNTVKYLHIHYVKTIGTLQFKMPFTCCSSVIKGCKMWTLVSISCRRLFSETGTSSPFIWYSGAFKPRQKRETVFYAFFFFNHFIKSFITSSFSGTSSSLTLLAADRVKSFKNVYLTSILYLHRLLNIMHLKNILQVNVPEYVSLH